MAMSECGHVVPCAFVLLILQTLFAQQIGNLTIRPLKDGKVIVTVKDIPNLNYFEFEGSINKKLKPGISGDISISVPNKINGLWSDWDNAQLKIGDTIYYNVHYAVPGAGYSDNGSFYVTELFDSEEQASLPASKSLLKPFSPPTSTSVIKEFGMSDSEKFYSGQVIFEEHFNTIREDYWLIEQYIPQEPEFPFVSFQRKALSIQNGMLQIQPELHEEYIEEGKILDLTVGCTKQGLSYCRSTTKGFNIINPIVSGRITTKPFAFKYGVIEIRAKLPQGDWLYPDIFLTRNIGGREIILRIVGARGNSLLNVGQEQLGNKVLYAGPVIDDKCRDTFTLKYTSSTEWGKDFHTYSVKWTADAATFLVDGIEWGQVNLNQNELLSLLPKDDSCRELLYTEKPLFSEFFGITLGISAGGIREFPDNALSNTKKKPWMNLNAKNRLDFYRDKDAWFRTWSQSALLVDFVRVLAL